MILMPFAISILIGYKTKFMAGVYIILGKYLQLHYRFLIADTPLIRVRHLPRTNLKILIVRVVIGDRLNPCIESEAKSTVQKDENARS